MTRKSAAAIASCVAVLVGVGVYASPQYTAWRAPWAPSSRVDGGQSDADAVESGARAKAEPALRDAAIAWGQVHLGVNTFIYGTFSVSAGPARFACGSLALPPSRQVTMVIVAPDGSVHQVEGAEAKREFLERCSVVLL